jgi:hypothetical protein
LGHDFPSWLARSKAALPRKGKGYTEVHARDARASTDPFPLDVLEPAMSDVGSEGSMYARFVRGASTGIDSWRDPEHDLEAIRLASEDDRRRIEQFLLARGIGCFIDAQALALLDSPRAREALLEAFRTGSTETRAAVAHLVPELIGEQHRIDELVQRIGECDAYEGLSLTLDQIADTHPPPVVHAMLERIACDPGVAATHFAAMLYFLHGLSGEPFDWSHRPFFLRFNPGDDADRREALRELCQRVGRDPEPLLALMERS